MIKILKYKVRSNYPVLFYLLLVTCFFFVCGSVHILFAQENGDQKTPKATSAPHLLLLDDDSKLPFKPINPFPADGAVNQPSDTLLNWENGGLATSYDVYFGTNINPGTNEFKGNQTTTTYDPDTLLNDTAYYWLFDSKNVTGTTTGDVWQFSTSSATIEENCCIGSICSPLSTSNCQQAGGIPINASCDPNPCG